MIDFLRVLRTPRCWLQNELYSAQWEKRLGQLAMDNNFVREGGHIARLDTTRIWISNHPYASFVPIIEGTVCTKLPVRPRRATILKAMDKLVKDTT